MKRLLLPLLAALALPSAVSAESYWLLIRTTEGGLQKIEMSSIAQCEEEGVKAAKRIVSIGVGGNRNKFYTCVTGK